MWKVSGFAWKSHVLMPEAGPRPRTYCPREESRPEAGDHTQPWTARSDGPRPPVPSETCRLRVSRRARGRFSRTLGIDLTPRDSGRGPRHSGAFLRGQGVEDQQAVAAVFAALLASGTSPTARPGPESATVTGTVVERVDRALYSLLRLTSDKGQVLVALPMAEVERRMKVIAKNGAVLKNFESEQSRRKFEAVCVRGDGDGVEAERAGGLTA